MFQSETNRLSKVKVEKAHAVDSVDSDANAYRLETERLRDLKPVKG